MTSKIAAEQEQRRRADARRAKQRLIGQRAAEDRRQALSTMRSTLLRSPVPLDDSGRLGCARIVPLYESERLVGRGNVSMWPASSPSSPQAPSRPLPSEMTSIQMLAPIGRQPSANNFDWMRPSPCGTPMQRPIRISRALERLCQGLAGVVPDEESQPLGLNQMVQTQCRQPGQSKRAVSKSLPSLRPRTHYVPPSFSLSIIPADKVTLSRSDPRQSPIVM